MRPLDASLCFKANLVNGALCSRLAAHDSTRGALRAESFVLSHGLMSKHADLSGLIARSRHPTGAGVGLELVDSIF